MSLKKYKPTSPGRRNMTSQDFSMVTVAEPNKKLVAPRKANAGRNSAGRITVRHQGAGVKQLYRIIDFKRDKIDMPAVVESIEYDPNRSARIALIRYEDNEVRYILSPLGLKVSDSIMSGSSAPIRPGNALKIKDIPTGVQIHNVEMNPGRGGQLGRSAGNAISILAKEGKYATLKLGSGELRRVLVDCMATIGQVGNILHSTVIIGQAGRQRLMGRRPTVRGKVMSPRSHPHGGGEGNTGIGLRKGPKTPWGALALGVKTRKRKNPSQIHIVSKRTR